MNNLRRNVLKGAGSAGVVSVAVMAGLLKPGMAFADWNAAGFQAKDLATAMGAAGAIIAKLNGLPTPEPFFANTCFSITDDDWGFSVVHVYRLQDGKLVYIKEAGGISPVKMDSEEGLKLQRKLEAEYAVGWLKNIMTDAFA